MTTEDYKNTGNQIYQQYKQSEIEAQGLSSSIVGRMAEDKDRNLWICTEGGGICTGKQDLRSNFKSDIRYALSKTEADAGTDFTEDEPQ